MPTRKINLAAIRKMALALPGVEEGTIHGSPSFKVRGRLLCCPALHGSAGADSLAVRVDDGERARLIEANPSVCYVTDHYVNHSVVLIRLSRINQESLKHLLRTAWKFMTESKTSRSRGAKPGGSEKRS